MYTNSLNEKTLFNECLTLTDEFLMELKSILYKYHKLLGYF